MSDPEVVKGYLEHFYPEIAAIARLEYLEQQTNKALRPSLKLFESDIIYRCLLEGEEECYFYFCLLFEHKSEPDKHVAVQVGLYMMELMYKGTRNGKRPLEPVLPLIFYNGKAAWQPRTIGQLLEDHPYYNLLEPYLPDFRFLFKDVGKMSPEELTDLEISYFRSVLTAMAFRHRPHLIFQNLGVIFEGAEDKEKIKATVTYILGVVERSAETFMDKLDETEFTTKANVMSTLEQFIEMGRKQGREQSQEEWLDKGEQKKSIFHLLKTLVKFPQLTNEELADFTEQPLKTVQSIQEIISTGNASALSDYVQEELLSGIPLKEEEVEQLEILAKELTTTQ